MLERRAYCSEDLSGPSPRAATERNDFIRLGDGRWDAETTGFGGIAAGEGVHGPWWLASAPS